MRSKVIALALTVLALMGATSAAEARWPHRNHVWFGPAPVAYRPVVTHHVYRPQYEHVYYVHTYGPDRFGYRFEPRGYYPYYNSGYWRPTRELMFRKACCRPYSALPPYYQAWGYPNRAYNHVGWHARYYGGHRRGHW